MIQGKEDPVPERKGKPGWYGNHIQAEDSMEKSSLQEGFAIPGRQPAFQEGGWALGRRWLGCREKTEFS